MSVPLAGEGLRPLAVLLGLTAVTARRWPRLALLPLGLAGLTAFFFRDPERAIVAPPGVALAPADGWVLAVREVDDDRLGRRMVEIVVFLSMLDVHVQRCPLAATVVATEHTPGPKGAAGFLNATERNERTAVYLDADGTPSVVTQIAGLIARTIVTKVAPGQRLAAGERLGMIKFGSQTTLRLPTDWVPLVGARQHVTAGLTPVARRRAAPAGG